jgi:hypothetical protein
MDIKELIEKVVDAIKDSETTKKQWEKEPVKVIEKFIGVDLPDEIVEKVIDGVKAKIAIDQVADVAGALKGLFKK